jgi:hypothetical protein
MFATGVKKSFLENKVKAKGALLCFFPFARTAVWVLLFFSIMVSPAKANTWAGVPSG